NGVVSSLGQTQDIIARKALLAADWQLMIMMMIWPVSNFFSIWWGRIFEKSCHQSRYFLVVGFLGRFSLVFGIWVTTMNEYLVLLALMFSMNSLLIPAQNSIYQKNIDFSRRAKIYGYTISLGMLVSIGITFLAGRVLDTREDLFRILLAFTGVCGLISCILLSLIKIQKPDLPCSAEKVDLKQMLLDPIQRTMKLLKQNKQFAAFERSYSIYGMGFIMMTPIIPIYLVDVLKLSYTSNFMAKGVISQLGLLLLSPYIGKIHDRMHPFRFISMAFAMLFIFPVLIIISAIFATVPLVPVILVFIAYLVFGIAMAAVNISWNMSSIYFAGKEDAAMYQSVHVTMTGIRGVIAPGLGLLLMKFIGITAVFVVAAGFLITASIISYLDDRKLKREYYPPALPDK
ncbi:MAG: MFS transporter, partial [Candidatus Cloacimonadaceae bacterium]|nr:MFS transporter [Candidatus Cloacimonadaceae bacterium]